MYSCTERGKGRREGVREGGRDKVEGEGDDGDAGEMVVRIL